MKEIGWRIGGTNTIRIVELTESEFNLVREFLAKVPDMKNKFNEWRVRFIEKVYQLKLDTPLVNALVEWACRADVEPYKFAFSDADGNSLEFDQWREMLLSRPMSKENLARSSWMISKLLDLGHHNIEPLIVALKEYTTNDNPC